MDAITIVIMIILFILAMLFVFSTALLTPYIGKKNLISVILLGLVVGLVGGAFLLSPIADDIPSFTRMVVEENAQGTDLVELNLSTNGNLTQIIQNISSISGVEKMEYEGITFRTDEFEAPLYERSFVSALNYSNKNISNVEEIDNNTYFVTIVENGDPQSVLDSIYATFTAKNYAHLRYTSMEANVTVKANNITDVMTAISNNEAVITNVSGPTEDQVNWLNQYLPNQSEIVLFSGILGVIVAIAGFFIDSIISYIKKSRRKSSRRDITERDKIRRKVVPGSKNRKTIPNKDSIDIFNEDFDNNPKQNLGSNRRFKQLSQDDIKKRQVNTKPEEKKSDKGFLSRFSGSKNKDKKVEKHTKEENKKSKRKVPKIRPKRKD